MASTHPATPPTAPPRRVLVLVLAVLQAASPALFALTGSTALDEDRPGQPAIVPAGWAFTVWAVVCGVSVVYGGWQLRRGRGDDPVKDALAGPLCLVFAGFALWLAAAASPLPALTVPVFAAMLAALVVALRRLHHRPGSASLTRGARALTATTVGVYAGWTAAALWVDVATVLAPAVPATGLDPEGTVAWLGQAGVLAAATATLSVVARTTGARIPFVLAGAWALIGVAAGAAEAGAASLSVVAAVGLLGFLTVAAATRRRTRRDGAGVVAGFDRSAPAGG